MKSKVPQTLRAPALGLLIICFLVSTFPLSGQMQAPLVPNRPPYTAPPLSDFSVLADPGVITAFHLLEASDMPGFQAELRRQALAGNPAAQLLYGMQFVPLEAFAPPTPEQVRSGHLTPTIIPLTPDPRPGRPEPSFIDALHWLRLASAAGSGEASEVVAQLITRILGAGIPSALTLDDAIRYRTLAVHQGYDLEAADFRCFRLLPGNKPVTCTSGGPASDTSAAPCPDPSTLTTLRQAGLRGRLLPGSTVAASYTSATMHPGGAPAHALVILDHPITAEQHLPLPRHATAIYLQRPDGFHVLAPDAPVLSRDIILRPELDAGHSVLGSVEDMNGGRGGSTCLSFDLPVPEP